MILVDACCRQPVPRRGRAAPVTMSTAADDAARPAAQEQIHLLHDLLDRCSQPGSHRHEPDAVPGVLHRLALWPAGEVGDLAGPARDPGAHQPMVEAEEVDTAASCVATSLQSHCSSSIRMTPPSCPCARRSRSTRRAAGCRVRRGRRPAPPARSRCGDSSSRTTLMLASRCAGPSRARRARRAGPAPALTRRRAGASTARPMPRRGMRGAHRCRPTAARDVDPVA
jgi:hypothetical protein